MSRNAPGTVPESTPDRFPDPEAESVSYNPSEAELVALATDGTETEFGSHAFVSEQRSRRADRTKNAVDDEFTDRDWSAIDDALDAAPDRELICMDRVVGREFSFVCRYYVPVQYARIALAWGKLLEPAPEGAEPDFLTLQLPDWPETAIRVLPDEGATIVFGSDYTGEAKKSFLRLFMRRAKEAGGLGLHAGSKRTVVERDGEPEPVRQLFLGLSGTGKSTLTGHGCWLDSPEGTSMLQDDVCAFLPDGSVAGSEGAGLYVKTDGLDREEQPALYDAATSPDVVLENVAVDDDGTVDFDDDELTANGRAVVRREDLASADSEIDADGADQVFFITRNPLAPPIARLSPEQAAVTFMLGESIQTSAGDPDSAGEAIRVVGTNPFIVGPEGEEGNRFSDLLADHDVEPYLLNTGSVGGADIRVEDTIGLLVAAARGEIEWTRDDLLGLDVPAAAHGVDLDRLDLYATVDDLERRIEDQRRERLAYLSAFETLREGLRDAVY